MRYPKRNGFAMVVPVLTALIAAGCGSDSDDAATTTTTEPFSETSVTQVASLTAIPDVGNLMITESSSLALQNSSDAVTGTPPNFNSITKDNIEEYLITSVDTLVTNMTTAATSQDWDTFETHMQSFRDGQNKCYVMQDAARQISDLGQASGSSCYMKRVDAETGTRLIEYVSGDEVDQGQYFVPGTETSYRALQLEFDGQVGETIVFELQGTSVESGVYQVALNFCGDDGTARSKEIIRVDNNTGVLTITNTGGGTEDFDGEEFTWANHMVLTAGLKAVTDGTIEFDPAVARKLTINGSDSGSWGTGNFSGSIQISDSKLTTKFLSAGSNTFNNQTFTYSDKSASVVSYSGTSFAAVKVFEAAGKRTGSFKDPNETEPFTHSGEITFEFNENEAPKYATIATSTLKTELDLIDFTTDELLSQTEPAAVTEVDSTACAVTPTSVYKLNMASEGMIPVQAACESEFSDGDSICFAIQQKEDQVWDVINSYQENNP